MIAIECEPCHSRPCPCPSQFVYSVFLKSEWVKYEVCKNVLGRGTGMNITAQSG